MKKYLLLSAILIISTSFRPSSTSVFDLHFEPNDHLLSENAYPLLAEATQNALAAKWGYQIGLEIFPTDHDALDRERVDEIVDYLEEKKIKVDKILYYSNPAHVPTDVKSKKDWNFIRLSIDYQLPPTVSAVEKNTKKATEKKAVISKKIPQWARKVVDYKENEEQFSISNFSEIELKTADGSFIKFEPESFVFEDGTTVTTPIKIVTKHATTKDVAILEELTTISDGELLESRGMIYVNATSMGKQLRLAEGKEMQISLRVQPLENNSKGFDGWQRRNDVGGQLIEEKVETQPITNQPEVGFQAYKGERKETNGQMNWSLEDKPDATLKKENDEYRFYKKVKLSDKERRTINAKRQTIINDWKRKGYSRKKIRKSLKRYKKYIRKKDNNLRYRIRKRVDRRQPSLRKSAILGKTKFKYVEYDKKYAVKRKFFYRVKSRGFGWKNLDRPLKIDKPPCDLFVQADEGMNVKIVLKDYFGVYKGILDEGRFLFANLPSTLKITVIAAKKLPNGKVKYAYKKTRLDDKTVVFSDYKTVSEFDYLRALKRLKV